MTDSPGSVTRLLILWSEGDNSALDQLAPLVYQELERVARRYLRQERINHTLQTSDLVHEAFLKLIDQHSVRWQNRAHFFGIAASLMRRILVDYARFRSARKRRGDGLRISLSQADRLVQHPDVDLALLDEALTKLEAVDARMAKIVELRFFAGLSGEEAAEVLGISRSTLERDWAVARAWLRREIAS